MKNSPGRGFLIVALIILAVVFIGQGWFITHNPCGIEGPVGTFFSVIFWGVDALYLGLFVVFLTHLIMRKDVWRTDRHFTEKRITDGLKVHAEDRIEDNGSFHLVICHVTCNTEEAGHSDGKGFMSSVRSVIQSTGEERPSNGKIFYGTNRWAYTKAKRDGIKYMKTCVAMKPRITKRGIAVLATFALTLTGIAIIFVLEGHYELPKWIVLVPAVVPFVAWRFLLVRTSWRDLFPPRTK